MLKDTATWMVLKLRWYCLHCVDLRKSIVVKSLLLTKSSFYIRCIPVLVRGC